MRKAGLILLIILTFAAIAAMAYLWIPVLVNSIYGYTTPLKGTPPLTEGSTRSLTLQVVLVLIDGLRYDTSLQMPYLNTLRKQGAQAILAAHPPANSQTAWTTLLSGAGPEINGAPLFDPTYEGTRSMSVDHFFAALNRAGLTGGIAGFHWWEKLVPTDALYTNFYVSAQDDAADKSIVNHALVFLNEFRPNFLLVHLSQMNTTGLCYGATSPEYLQAALRCDEYIRLLATNMNLAHSVLIVVSSHGQLDQGGYGGDESVLLNTPFVMVGKSVLPGNYPVMDQADLAPTLAALLGTPTPSAAQGKARLDMLRTEPVEKAEKLVALASQRVHFGNIYLYSIGRVALSETAQGDMLVAQSSLQVKNYESAVELAALAIEQTGLEMTQVRYSRIWNERRQRAVPLAILTLMLLWIVWHWRSRQMVRSMFAAVLAVVVYHALFLQQGNAYSFSRIPNGGLAATLNPSIERAAIALALGAIIITWRTWRERVRSIFSVIMRTYAYAALQVYLVALLVGACACWNGPRFTWYLPDLKITYMYFIALEQLMLISAMAIPLPFIVVTLQRILLAISDHVTTTYRK